MNAVVMTDEQKRARLEELRVKKAAAMADPAKQQFLSQQTPQNAAVLEQAMTQTPASTPMTPPQEESGFMEAAAQTGRTLLQAPITDLGAGFSGLLELALTQDPQRAAEAVNRFR